MKYLGCDTLIIIGLTGDICILFPASDCVVSQDREENDRVLRFMERVLDADIRPSSKLDLAAKADGE